jgi:hypothetical protein
MSLDKTRRGRLGGAAGFAAFALFECFLARRAQLNHTVLNYKGSWFTAEAGYIVAACLFAMAIFLIVSALRRSDNQKR